MNFFIIHGIYGNPKENWFPWLKKELEQAGHEVIVPNFPTPLNNNLESWLRVFSEFENKVNEGTILIGHSQGVPFILNYLENADKKIKAAFLVAGFHKPIDNEFKELTKTFVEKEFNWSRIKEKCEKFFVFISDNDPYIPMEINKDLAPILGAELNIIKSGGHLNSKAGYDEFPLLLDTILIEL